MEHDRFGRDDEMAPMLQRDFAVLLPERWYRVTQISARCDEGGETIYGKARFAVGYYWSPWSESERRIATCG